MTKIAGVRIKRADGHYYVGTADHKPMWSPRAALAATFQRAEDAERRIKGMKGLAVTVEAVEGERA